MGVSIVELTKKRIKIKVHHSKECTYVPEEVVHLSW